MAGFFLKAHQLFPHMVEQIDGQTPSGLGVQAFAVLGVVAHHLVQPIHANGGEMVAQRAQVSLGVGIQPGIHVVLNHLALDL